CVATTLFAGIDELVGALEQQTIAWGIVTNKISRYTTPLTQSLGLHQRTSCIVSGDTCARAKPHPDPLLHAARLLHVEPESCLYVGDDRRDIEAARAAGMLGVAALYGYLGLESSPSTWQAWASIQTPLALLEHIG
ncbi:MAG: HAD-IA family hydrolase, partial [Betaproteobacteria bacterium]|nr:HAD-IA family hydrolase [Betaproteobacteria bacterium]